MKITKKDMLQKKLGGGVILCFIHEIDYANYLFENPFVYLMVEKKVNLKLMLRIMQKL